jgi:response regulator RpfG family c-di-GMP phosphodiesterase
MSNFGSVLSSDRINLAKINFLVIDDNRYCLDIMAQVLTGFSVGSITKCANAKEARQVLSERVIDFILTDATMPDESGYDFLEWVRRNAGESNRFVPAIIITGHTKISQVARGRDCGAHFVIAKPITPKIILERLFWVARDSRMFIESDTYCGVDRRFRIEAPPNGMKGRRHDDVEPEVAERYFADGGQELDVAPMEPSKVAQ